MFICYLAKLALQQIVCHHYGCETYKELANPFFIQARMKKEIVWLAASDQTQTLFNIW